MFHYRFGGLLTIPTFLSLNITLITVGVFALAHGYAHGKEMPIFVLPEIYILGFMVATSIVHIIGVALGEIMNRLPGHQIIYKITGVFLVISGIYFII